MRGIFAVFLISFLDPVSTYVAVKADVIETNPLAVYIIKLADKKGYPILFLLKFIFWSVFAGIFFLYDDVRFYDSVVSTRFLIILIFLFTDSLTALWNFNEAIKAWRFQESSSSP
jgi:hypothetical protein